MWGEAQEKAFREVKLRLKNPFAFAKGRRQIYSVVRYKY